jgi:hypothetical protein
LRGNFVLLRADTLRLLLPQEEVGAAEYLEARPESTGEPGLLRLATDHDERGFAALSAQMTLLPQCPAERFVVAALGDGSDGLGWCWDDLKVLIDIELQPQPIPAVLVAPDAPVDHYAEHAGELAFLCSARRLTEFALASRS